MRGGTEAALERLLRAYGDYYNVRPTPEGPFAAEAVFHSHEEGYFLVRSARLFEMESHEYVFFAREEVLDAARLRALDEAAWRTGTARITPGANHRNSDVTLIILAERAEAEALALVPRLRHYRSYRWGLQGWSHYHLFAVETSTGRCAWNRQGKRLRELIQSNILEAGTPLEKGRMT